MCVGGMNLALRFIGTLRERYDWTDEELEAEWECAKTNPQAVWGKDEYNVPVVSLLKITEATNARKLAHENAITRKKGVETDDLESAFTGYLSIAVCRYVRFSLGVLQLSRSPSFTA